MKYVIIGGVAGGATAAARLRRIDEQAEIILLEKGKYISYANCGLPYYIGGVIAEREKLLVQTPASFGKRFRIDVRVENEVIAIDPEKKTLTIRKADGKEYEETYDKLLLSPGANPVKPPLEGIDSEGIFTLRNVEDTDRIKAYIIDKQVKRAVVVGAGFIGLEMAENLHHAGVAVSVVEMGNQVMAPIDFSMAAPIHQHLIEKGVSLYLEEGVTRFRRTEEGITVFLKSGKTIPVDMVLLSIGVRPATALAQQAGLELGVQQALVHIAGHHFGKEQVVAAQRDHLGHFAFQVHRAFRQHRAVGEHAARLGMQAAGGKLVHIAAALHAAPIHRPHQCFGGQVDGKLPALLNEVVAEPFRPHADAHHAGLCADGARPADGDEVGVLQPAAGHQHRRFRVQQGTAPPALFAHP